MLPYLLYTTDPGRYGAYLEEKAAQVWSSLAEVAPLPEPQAFPSAPEFFRMRLELGVRWSGDRLGFVMFRPRPHPRGESPFVEVNTFRAASLPINAAMGALRELLPQSSELSRRLFEVDFLAVQDGEMIISLIYHRQLVEAGWHAAATILQGQLRDRGIRAHLTARARNQHLVLDIDRLTERYEVGGETYRLVQVEGSFTQPNAGVCERMLAFAQSAARDLGEGNLLELYCGSGTFTVALAPLFPRVLATEVSREATVNAQENLQMNQVGNVSLVRLSAQETQQALDGVRPFRRLQEAGINVADLGIGTLFIDPPRQGLRSEEARAFTARFGTVIYVSCGHEALREDLAVLSRTHKVARLGFFDQFPYTPHLETICVLRRR
ncbi:MAG: tRNA (uridine(54)-C5)-methyltransferase TrmA [Succinivibrionaceae bacterium]|nr:tRNA (uridine(54)-C5)-methyltransferase TrmA [Succinivibrionaceae bacterium]